VLKGLSGFDNEYIDLPVIVGSFINYDIIVLDIITHTIQNYKNEPSYNRCIISKKIRIMLVNDGLILLR
jgi:hypothetical protein